MCTLAMTIAKWGEDREREGGGERRADATGVNGWMKRLGLLEVQMGDL